MSKKHYITVGLSYVKFQGFRSHIILKNGFTLFFQNLLSNQIHINQLMFLFIFYYLRSLTFCKRSPVFWTFGFWTNQQDRTPALKQKWEKQLLQEQFLDMQFYFCQLSTFWVTKKKFLQMISRTKFMLQVNYNVFNSRFWHRGQHSSLVAQCFTFSLLA